jgi:hypothetical protein
MNLSSKTFSTSKKERKNKRKLPAGGRVHQQLNIFVILTTAISLFSLSFLQELKPER